MINSVGREIPDTIAGFKSMIPFRGAFEKGGSSPDFPSKKTRLLQGNRKVLTSMREALEKVGVESGMTVSFHHHFRNGDYVLNSVMNEISKMGVRNTKIASSSIFPCHEPLVTLIQKGVVTAIDTDYMTGPVAQAVSRGLLEAPVTLRTHGGRARAIDDGDLHIDVAFIAAPTADVQGNINGVDGPSKCGSLGYAVPDASHADKVVAVTDNLVNYPLTYVSIDQTHIDYVVKLDKIGDSTGIISGTTAITRSPIALKIAEYTAKVIEASGLLQNGFSFQTGAGGTSLATASFVRQIMKERKVTGSFGLGGITGFFVEMLEEGLFKALLDVQCLDLKAVDSLKKDLNHIEIGSSMYANPRTKGNAVDMLDVVVLGATEIDAEFNVNVTTGSHGDIMGGSGGHGDAAEGSKLCIVVAPLIRSRLPTVVERPVTISTPGEIIDVFVTERGIAVNPGREDIKQRLVDAKLPVVEMEKLRDTAKRICGKPTPIRFKDRILAVQEYRDGTVIDVIREVE